MAVYRQLQISFWQDEFVDELTPEERYFYIYLLTNTKTTQCGIYKFNIRLAELETGYTRETVQKLLDRFISYGKIIVSKKTKELMVVNWVRYNFINSKNTIICINKELKSVKDKDFLAKYYKICKDRDYPVSQIFAGIEIEGFTHGFEAPSYDLGEEETGEEIKTEEKSEEKETGRPENQLAINHEHQESNFKDVVDAFDSNIHPITPVEYERLSDWAGDLACDVIILAIGEAVSNNARSISYINAVLNNWFSLGLKDKKAVESYLMERVVRKNRNKTRDNNVKKANAAAYKVLEDTEDE